MKVLPTPSRTRADAGEACADWFMSDLKDRGDEKLRVGLPRVVENLVREAGLDHAALPHHHQSVRKQPRHCEVVRHDDH